MRKVLLILFSFTSLWSADACSCRGVSDYFSFFKSGQNLLVGQVISLFETSEYLIYDIKVLEKFRGKFKPIEQIYSSKQGMCQLHVQTGAIYLIEVNELRGKLRAGYCSFKEESTRKGFREDTALINMLGKKNVFIRSQYFQGQLINDKRVGNWIYYGNDTTQIVEKGNYVNGKKDGKWDAYGAEVYYRNGKFLKMEEIVSDSIPAKVITTNKQKTMYYSDGRVWKTMTNTKYRVFYPNGNLKETAIIKDGILTGQWIRYNRDGTIVRKIDGGEGSYDLGLWFYITKEPKYFTD